MSLAPDVVAVESFLLSLFADQDGSFYGQYLLIWTLQDKRSAWVQTTDAAVDYVAEHCDAKDTYVGVGYSPRDFGPAQRCKIADISGLNLRWLDVDFLSELAHKGKSYPPTIDEARKLLTEYELPPTMLVHSGHGLQAWWKFEKPWLFVNEQERAVAVAEAKAWSDGWRAIAAKLGYEIDATGDLARVFRLPGTWNLKAEPVQVTTLEYLPERVYDPAKLVLPVTLGRSRGRAIPRERSVNDKASDLTFDPHANPPFDRWECLKEAEPKARRSWEHKRKDFKDQSASTYDQALADYAVQAGWSDQEITNLLIAHRRTKGEDLKRLDYYVTTIRKARDFVDPMDAAKLAGSGLEVSSLDPSSRAEAIAKLSSLFRVTITNVTRFMSSTPVFRLEMEKDGERQGVMLGDVSTIMEHAKFRNKIAGATLHVIPAVKKSAWEPVAQAILNVCETVDLGVDATDEGLARTWISSYLQHIRTLRESAQEALSAEKAYIDNDGRICVYSSLFKHWLTTNQFEKITRQQLAQIMGVSGCTSGVVNIRIAGQHTTRGIWRLSGEWTVPEPDDAAETPELATGGVE